MARLQKGQSYDALGFRVDGNGIATDLKTGATLSRADVDSRLAGTDYSNFKHRRGGVAGSYDRNKQWMVPAAEFAAGFIPGIGPAISAGIGAATGFDREGKSGIGFDFKKGAMGGVSGYGMGNLGSMAKSGLGKMFGAGAQGAGNTTVAGYSPNPAAGAGGASTAPPVSAAERALLTPGSMSEAMAPSTALPQASGFGDVANAGKVFGNVPIPGTPATPAPHGLLNFAKNNTNLLAGAFGALSEYPKNQAESEYAKAQADALRRKMAWEDEDRANAQSKTDLLAKLLMGGFYGRPTVSL